MFQTNEELDFFKNRVYIFILIHKMDIKILEKSTLIYGYQQKDVDKPKRIEKQPINWVFPQFVNNHF